MKRCEASKLVGKSVVHFLPRTAVPLESDELRTIDYRKYYDLERYLFDEVTKTFEKTHTLNAFDFFCIVIWKANRAKSNVANRLLSRKYTDLDQAVLALSKKVASALDKKARMKVLISDWGFRLPMASAILTVLYPKDFTIYDVRVCEVLNKFHNTQNLTDFEKMWSEYEDYIDAVQKQVTENYDLRDKDRWLWGKSFSDQLKKDIAAKFKKVPEENGTEE
jgi:hypothetical protein